MLFDEDDLGPDDLAGSASHSGPAGPTPIRHLVVAVTCLASLLLYLDRFCMNYAQRYVKEDLGLTDQHLAWCMSAFFLSYALGQVPSGWLTDRFGARLMLTLYIAVWSFFTAAMGWVSGLAMLLLVRLAAGLGQAGAYPTAAAVVGRWVPLTRRGIASSLIAMGGRFGAFLAPLLTAYLIIFFVPPDTPVRLSGSDLYDLRPIATGLTHAADTASDGELLTEEQLARHAVQRRIGNGLDDSTRSALARLTDLSKDEPVVDAESLRSDLSTRLNTLIEDPGFIKDIPVHVLPLEKEALRMLDADADLSPVQRQRLHRLVLEAVYPDGIRKLYVAGWRPVMLVYGLLGVIVALAYYVVVRDRPGRHPWVNQSEVDLIQEGRPPESSLAAAATLGPPPMRAILCSPSLWLLSIAQFGTNIGWVFLVTWLPRYLLEVHHASFEDRGWMASWPMFAGWIGMLCGGWWTDRLTLRLGRRRGRAIPLSASRFVAMAAFLLALLEPSAWMATALFAVVAFSTDLGSPATWAYNQDVGGRYIASVLGWGNMWGNLGAAVSPILLESIVRQSGGSWDAAFLTCAAAFLVSGLCGMFVNADKPIDSVRD